MERIKRRTKVAIVISVGLILATILISNPESVAEALVGVNYIIIAFVVLLYFINLFLKSFRWGLLMQGTKNNIPFVSIFATFSFSQAVNNVIPGRMAGEVNRLYEMRAKENVSIGTCLATVVSERLMDFIVLTILCITSIMLLLALLVDDTRNQLIAAVVVMIVINFLFIYLLLKPKFLRKVGDLTAKTVRMISKGEMGEKAADNIKGFVDSFITSMHSITMGEKRILIGYAGILTIVIWTNEIVRLFLIVEALGIHASLVAIVATASIASLGAVFLSAGSSYVVVSSAIFTASGISYDIATTVGILSALTSIWISVPVGIIAFILYERYYKPSTSVESHES